MKAIVSVFAKDSKGITAYVTALLAEKEINILDISQTILQENFTMIMLVDISACSVSFDEMSRLLSELGSSMELSIRIQREEIFNAMHRI